MAASYSFRGWEWTALLEGYPGMKDRFAQYPPVGDRRSHAHGSDHYACRTTFLLSCHTRPRGPCQGSSSQGHPALGWSPTLPAEVPVAAFTQRYEVSGGIPPTYSPGEYVVNRQFRPVAGAARPTPVRIPGKGEPSRLTPCEVSAGKQDYGHGEEGLIHQGEEVVWPTPGNLFIPCRGQGCSGGSVFWFHKRGGG